MGNALRFLCGPCRRPTAADEPQELGSHGVGVSALAQDLRLFHANSQIPAGLSQYVNSSKKAQINWYSELLKAWNEARPPPKNPEAAARLVIQTLQNIGKANLEGFLAFYCLPVPQTTEEGTEVIPPEVRPPWAEGVQSELLTLPIDERAVGDGDGFIAYVSTEEQSESDRIPHEVKDAVKRRQKARAAKDFKQAKLIKEKINAAGYGFITLPKQKEILAHKYRIRLRGIDAPELKMPYGEEAKQVLAKMIKGKCLQIHVYEEDKFGRKVGDVYCNGIFIQEQLLKRGCAWHYLAFDARPEFAEWEKKARAKRRGLWALPNPEEPWVWKKKNLNPREH